MIPPGVVIVVVLAGSLAVLAAIVFVTYLLRNFISPDQVPPDQRGVGGAEDPRRIADWEDFGCLFGIMAMLVFVLVSLVVAFVVTQSLG